LKDAKAEGEEIIRKAELRAKDIVNNDELIKQSKQKASEIISNAQLQARDLRNVAKDYADGLLREVEESMSNSLSSVRKTRQNLKKLPTVETKKAKPTETIDSEEN